MVLVPLEMKYDSGRGWSHEIWNTSICLPESDRIVWIDEKITRPYMNNWRLSYHTDRKLLSRRRIECI